ncbi:MAG TPA: histidine--tRNA ligase [Nitrososphaerales archaeon]|nr:histidine--tRNA ligase [Nitrososphaerales archaeon]
MRDIEPDEYSRHAKVRGAFEDVARLYNFQVMEPAALEHLSILRAKSGEDVDKEIYAFKDKGGRDVGLRFDRTVGITRYVCSRRDLRLPAKIASFGGMWRYDEPQYGRYRWSHQWDLEIFGPPSVDSDAEVIDASSAILRRVGLQRALIKVGDRRVVEGFIRNKLGITDSAKMVELMRALDKVEKKTRRELEEEYTAKGFSRGELGELLALGELSGEPDKVLRKTSEMKLDFTEDLTRLRDILRSRGVANVEYSLRIVRGIDYYTGIVFEAVDGANLKLGSLCGGGRYDALPRALGRADLSATGAAGGVEREAMSMAEEQTVPGRSAVVACASPDAYGYASAVLAHIRGEGIPGDLSLPGRSLGKQLEDAAKAGVAWALIVGMKELAGKSVTLRDMKAGKEEVLPLSEAIRRLQK